jgi:hypothetical protein
MNKELGEPNDLYPRPKNIVRALSEKSERIAWSSNLTLKKNLRIDYFNFISIIYSRFGYHVNDCENAIVILSI